MPRKSISRSLLVLAVTGLSLGGCSSVSIPSPAVAPAVQHPAISMQQLDTINTSVFETVAAGDSSLDANSLISRVSGPALIERRLGYQKKSLLGEATSLSSLSDKMKYSAVSQSDVYPRVVIEIMEAPEGENLQTLDVLLQSNARRNWTLWAAMQILPAAVTPVISTGETGVTFIGADDSEGLVASPSAVLDAYIKLNQTREDANGLTFADDSFRTRLAQSQDKNANSIKDIGEATLNFSRGGEGPFAVRTEDGGALVIAEINYASAIRITKDGGSAAVPQNHDIAIAASGEADKEVKFTDSVTAHYTAALAFYVPPAGAENTTISLVAASQGAPFSVDVAQKG